jgi:hypothetical protein
MIGEHGGEGVLGASTYDTGRGAEWIKAHITLNDSCDRIHFILDILRILTVG